MEAILPETTTSAIISAGARVYIPLHSLLVILCENGSVESVGAKDHPERNDVSMMIIFPPIRNYTTQPIVEHLSQIQSMKRRHRSAIAFARGHGLPWAISQKWYTKVVKDPVFLSLLAREKVQFLV